MPADRHTSAELREEAVPTVAPVYEAPRVLWEEQFAPLTMTSCPPLGGPNCFVGGHGPEDGPPPSE